MNSANGAAQLRTLRDELDDPFNGPRNRVWLDLLSENRERWNTARLVAVLHRRVGDESPLHRLKSADTGRNVKPVFAPPLDEGDRP